MQGIIEIRIVIKFSFSNKRKEATPVSDRHSGQEKNPSEKSKPEKSVRHENSVEEPSKSRSDDEARHSKVAARKEPSSPSKQDKAKASAVVKTDR